MNNQKRISERDAKHLWHPLTQHKTAGPALAIKRAKGVYLYDEQDNAYIDAISSWYTAVYGHCNDVVIGKVSQQMLQLDQVVFAGFTHEPAVVMSEKLMEILPSNQRKIFFSDNGSTTIDIAIKMSLQYHFNNGDKKLKIIAFENAFHGDTFGAMSVSGLDVYNGPFEDVVLAVDRISVPTSENIHQVKKQFVDLLETAQVACFVFEPLIQGANCMNMYEAQFLDELITLAKSYNVLTIADEVMTGFGKTGTLFAVDQLQNKPDIMCLSKALTAGLLPMGLTTCTQKVFDAFSNESIVKGFFHGHTYSANPLACTAAIASIELIQTPAIKEGMQLIHESHVSFRQEINKLSCVKNVRVKGMVLAIDLAVSYHRYGKEYKNITAYFLSRGVFLRPLGNTIYILPPYVITQEELNFLYTEIKTFLLTQK